MPDPFQLRRVRVERSPLEVFEQFLRRRGKRMTRQRRLIIDQIFTHHDHFDADELLAHLQEMINKRLVSRPTVYRTLSDLVAAGLLRRMSIGGRSVYEYQYGYPSHDHLFCQGCNQLSEFQSPAMEKLCDRVARQYDFQVLGHRLFVIGICARCRAAGRTPEEQTEAPGPFLR